MTDWIRATPAELAEALRATLLLPGRPVGVRLFADAAEFDAWPADRPEEPTFYCAGIRKATLGQRLKLAATDISCDTSPRILGLEPGFRDRDFVESYVTGGLYKDLTVAESVLKDVVTLEAMAGVGMGPLASFGADAPPDVVIIATTPYGAMRTVQAGLYSGERVRSDSIGMHGTCAESTALPYVTGDVSVSLLCSGTRYVAGWEEELLSIGIPMARLASIVAGLVGTAERFETDERKEYMRVACQATTRKPNKITESLENLSEGTGYFCK